MGEAANPDVEKSLCLPETNRANVAPSLSTDVRDVRGEVSANRRLIRDAGAIEMFMMMPQPVEVASGSTKRSRCSWRRLGRLTSRSRAPGDREVRGVVLADRGRVRKHRAIEKFVARLTCVKPNLHARVSRAESRALAINLINP